MQAKDSFKGNSSLYTWLCTIAKNLWYNKCKKRNRDVSQEELLPDLPSGEKSTDAMLIDKDMARQVHRILHTIPVNESCEKLYLGDTLVWSKEENGGDAIPEYVYEFAKVYLQSSTVTDVESIIDEEDYVGVVYLDGRKVLWDLDGNVIFEGHEGDDENVIDEEERQNE